MNDCADCTHHELAQLTASAGGGEVALCYHPALVVDGGSSCEQNRAAGGKCANAEYFEPKEGTDAR